jgi:4'-phosphopantetheinyl transferase
MEPNMAGRDICSGEVHVWTIDLETAPRGGLRVLDAAERKRAERFVFDGDRRRFVASHAALRGILGGYLGAAPVELSFATSPFGKPFLEKASNAVDLRFNLSASGDVALVAVALGREVGVDVERERPGFDVLDMAEKFLSSEEAAGLAAVEDAAGRTSAFFGVWAAKEACIKAVGKGLSMSLESFSVPVKGAGEGYCVVIRPGDDAAEFTLVGLSVADGYAAAAACEGGAAEVTLRNWQGR